MCRTYEDDNWFNKIGLGLDEKRIHAWSIVFRFGYEIFKIT